MQDPAVTPISIIGDYLSQLVEAKTQKEICALAGSAVRTLYPHSYIIISLYEPDKTAMRIVWQCGFDRFLDPIRVLMGSDPLEKLYSTANISAQELAWYRDGRTHLIPNGLYTLSFRSVPQFVCAGIERLLGIGDCYCNGFAWNGLHYGGLVVALPRGTKLDDVRPIEIIVQQATISIRRVQAQDALRENEAMFTSFMEFSPTYVFFKDRNIRAVKLSRNFDQLLGMPIEVALGKSMEELFPGEMAQKMVADDRRILENGEVVRVVEELNGRSYETIKFPIMKDGVPDMLAGFTIDITDRILAEEQKRHAIEHLGTIQRLESLGVLAGGIAHDFNNLLGGIFGYIDLAHSRSGEQAITGYLGKALSSLERAKALTQQLLTFSKGGAPVRRCEQLTPLIRQTVEFGLSGTNVACTFDIDSDLWPCDIDRNQIGQVIDNLVINARQAMPSGGTIFVTAHNIESGPSAWQQVPPGCYVEISVRDTGAGMPPDVLAHIFDPFFTTKNTGSGLGLATSFSIVQRHGGAIDAQSQSGTGSTLRFILPASAGEYARAPQVEPKIHRGSGRILVMDDEETLRDICTRMLENMGYTVSSAEDGAEALELFTFAQRIGPPFCAAVFDLTVPAGMGGKEAAERIRILDPAIPIFVASGYADDPVIAHPRQHGFTDSVCKPYRAEDLAAVLSRHLPDGDGG